MTQSLSSAGEVPPPNPSPLEVARSASLAARAMAVLPSTSRVAALTAIHTALLTNRQKILDANACDLANARLAVSANILSSSLLSRLDLTKPGKYDEMLQGILDVRDLPDPIGRCTLRTALDDNLVLQRISCPIGVLLIIFEARPEVIANIVSLAIKSGNAAILKGGKESTDTFVTMADIISKALARTDIPPDAIQLLTSRARTIELLGQDRYIDLVIPRGSNELVRSIKNQTRIPVLGHADGLCSIYLHESASVAMAVPLLLDAKTAYPAACNAVETLLVDEAALNTTLPEIATALIAHGVTLRCDPQSLAALQHHLTPLSHPLLEPAAEADFETEFLALTLAVKTIPKSSTPTTYSSSTSISTPSPSSSTPPPPPPSFQAVDLAISHINTHGSHHTDCILTSLSSSSPPTTPAELAINTLAERFLAGVDSAGVFHNASTRFADGRRFGFGTEVGISTNKIHARGPVGVDGLMSYKYLLRGRGQFAGEYGEGVGLKGFKHEDMGGD